MPARPLFTARERTTLIGVVALFSIMTFEETAVVAALPSAARDLGGVGSFGWLYLGFVVAKIVGLAVAGQHSDRHGPRGALIAGLALFIASVLVCGAAPAMPVLIAGRIGGGFGDGVLLTSVYVVISQVFSATAVPRVQTAIGSTFVVPALAGPLVAGAIAQHIGWRWVFLGLAPFLIGASVLLWPVLRRLHAEPGGSVRRNILPFAVAVGIAVAALEQVGQHPPPWPVLVGEAAVAFGLLTWGVRALLPAGTLRLRPGVAAPIALRALFGGAFLGADAFIPLMMQLQHGYGATFAALPLAASDLLWAVGSWAQARAPSGDDTRYRVRLIRAGFGLTTIGTLIGAAVASPSVPGVWIYAACAFAGLGAGLAYSTFNVLVLRYTSEADRGFDLAASQLSGSVGLALTSGFGGILVAAAAQGTFEFRTAFMAIDLALSGVLVFGCAAAGRLRPPAGARPALATRA